MVVKDKLDRLIQSWHKGDREAIDELVRLIEPEIRRYVSHRMGRAERRWAQSGDIVQQVLIETFARLTPPEADFDREALRKRIYRTAKNRLIDAWRKWERELGTSVRGRGPVIGSSHDGPVTEADTKRWLQELAHQLPEKYSRVIFLCCFEELTFSEASQELGMTPDAVRKRYHRAREALLRKAKERSDVRG